MVTTSLQILVEKDLDGLGDHFCTKCPLGSTNSKTHRCISSKLFGASVSPSDNTPFIFILASDTTYDENINDCAFTGGKKNLILDAILASGLNKTHTIYLANSIKCWTTATPTASNIFTCGEYVAKELDYILNLHKNYKTLPLNSGILVVGENANRLVFEKSLRDCIKYNSGYSTINLYSFFNKYPKVNSSGFVSSDTLGAISTYDPGILERDPNKSLSIANHIALFTKMMMNEAPQKSNPNITNKTRPPKPTDSKILSIDIETYGSVVLNTNVALSSQELILSLGCSDAPQNYFHPKKSMAFDSVLTYKGIKLNPGDICFSNNCASVIVKESPKEKDLIQTISITLVDENTFDPTETIVWAFTDLSKREIQRWLDHADTIIGSNIQYDIMYLRAVGMDLPPFKKILLDTQVLNFMACDIREEKSLKDLGPVLGTHSYKENILKSGGKFHSRFDPDLHKYNSEDSHNTVLVGKSLIKEAEENNPNKVGSFTILHFSDLIWTAIRMSERGVDMCGENLEILAKFTANTLETIYENLLADVKNPVLICGAGSEKSTKEFIDKTCRFIMQVDPFNPLPDKLEYTKTKKEVSTGQGNRTLLLFELGKISRSATARPEESATAKEYMAILSLIQEFNQKEKLLSSYLIPLITGGKSDNNNKLLLTIQNLPEDFKVIPNKEEPQNVENIIDSKAKV